MRKTWSKDRVIEAIRLRREQGLSLTSVWREDRSLYEAAKLRFGRWTTALAAVGVSRPIPRTWTKERIIEAILARHRADLPLKGMQRHDWPLHSVAIREFGGWRKALIAAGLKPAVPRKWTKEQVIRQIQQWHQQGVPAAKLWQQDRNLTHVSANFFGSWRKALAAAGLVSVRQEWSKERVIQELKSRYPHTFPRSRFWKEDTLLTAAATRYFGSWHDALVAAGFRQGKRRTMRSWTKDEIIEAIRSRQRQGLSLTSVWRDNRALHSVAKRQFGSWRRAREVAGFPLESKELERDELIRRIQQRHAQGVPLSDIRDEGPAIERQATEYFGSWGKACLAAGLNVTTRQRWSPQSVIAAIRTRQEQGLRLCQTHKEDTPLFAAAARIFGGWEKALRAAGIDPKPRRKWTKQRVIVELQAWHRHSDENLRTADHALAGAAARLFGGITKAMEAAGVEPKSKYWTEQRVIEEIQDRFLKGQPINTVGFGDARLASAARRRFGSWREAVAAAGLLGKYTNTPRRSWSKEAVLDAIQTWHAQGRVVSNVCKQDAGLYNAAKRHFGGWRAAVIAAGLEPTRKQWTRQRVIEEIRMRHRQGASLNSGTVFKQDSPLAGAGTRLFGNWRAAVATASKGTTPKTRKGK